MAATQAGDQAACQRLLGEITPYLRSIAAQSLRAQDDVEDVVQEILLTVFQIRHTYDPSRPFGPWLATIARRRTIDRVRVRVRRLKRETPLEAIHETFAAPPAKEVTSAMDSAELARAMAQLPAGQRQALDLMKLKEMSLKEASAASGVSVAALKVATHRAIRSLRRILEPR